MTGDGGYSHLALVVLRPEMTGEVRQGLSVSHSSLALAELPSSRLLDPPERVVRGLRALLPSLVVGVETRPVVGARLPAVSLHLGQLQHLLVNRMEDVRPGHHQLLLSLCGGHLLPPPGGGAPAALDEDQERGEESEEDSHHHRHQPVVSLGGAELRDGLPLVVDLVLLPVLSAQVGARTGGRGGPSARRRRGPAEGGRRRAPS